MTFILASSKIGNKMKTGSTGVAIYKLPSVKENSHGHKGNEYFVLMLACTAYYSESKSLRSKHFCKYNHDQRLTGKLPSEM